MTLKIAGAPYTLLYVDDVPASAAKIATFLGVEPVHNEATFALFIVAGGKLGLWRIGDVLPLVAECPGSAEFALAIEGGPAAVDAAFDKAKEIGLIPIQAPTAMDFGYTFTAALEDGNRIRIFDTADDPR
ncbi:MAG: drug:proton antiporter [Fulvimarina manganoxydans]|uniref:drug:proton antiporter n=1 Tax=Fulvimarina manganoxydans TaxID=937218 RepID=UPI002354050D|nr:drug:proton antiporter [Fulvimarina manganoxydans]MCK5933171.1 drug:proton antiporter [Fulvimarina manganoxydans]